MKIPAHRPSKYKNVHVILSIMPMASKLQKIKHQPLSSFARSIIFLAAVINVLMLLDIAYYYPSLPNTIVTHYGSNGAPIAYGSKVDLLYAPIILFAVFALILLILRYRYTLFEKYPYLINLPSFVYVLGSEGDAEVRSKIMGRVFTVYALSTLYLAVLNVIITTVMLHRGASNLYIRFALPMIFATVCVFVITVLLVYRDIYKSFAKGKRR